MSLTRKGFPVAVSRPDTTQALFPGSTPPVTRAGTAANAARAAANADWAPSVFRAQLKPLGSVSPDTDRRAGRAAGRSAATSTIGRCSSWG
jgi:hypothetical protein